VAVGNSIHRWPVCSHHSGVVDYIPDTEWKMLLDSCLHYCLPDTLDRMWQRSGTQVLHHMLGLLAEQGPGNQLIDKNLWEPGNQLIGNSVLQHN